MWSVVSLDLLGSFSLLNPTPSSPWSRPQTPRPVTNRLRLHPGDQRVLRSGHQRKVATRNNTQTQPIIIFGRQGILG